MTSTAETIRSPEQGRYRVLRFHARGGLGQVSVALDEELGREVAFKEIQPDFAHDIESRERFLREAAITGRLEHPGIVPVYSLGIRGDGKPFYAMRFIQGDDLRSAIRRFHEQTHRNDGERGLALRSLLRRFVDVCNAVGFAHARGVVHRDLKPANIMLGPFGETLVVDWGLAKENEKLRLEGLKPSAKELVVEQAPVPADSSNEPPDEQTLIGTVIEQGDTPAGSANTRPGDILGTPAYMSPEQAKGAGIGPSSDIYSLGVILYEVLTGKLPYGGSDSLVVLAKAAIGSYNPPRVVQHDTPKPLDAICRKGMSLEPAHRYDSTLAFAADVEHWLADEPVAAYRESLLERSRRWARRHRTIVTTAIALLLTLTIAFASGFFLVSRERDRKELARKDAVTARDNEAAARQLTRSALNATTDDVIERLLARQPRLTEDERDFLKKVEGFYKSFASAGDNTAEARFSAADGHFRVARIRQRLDDRVGAETAFVEALALFQALAVESPNEPANRLGRANCRMNLGALYERTGRLKAAETEELASIADHRELTAAHPDSFDYRYYLAKVLNNFGLLLEMTGRQTDAEKAFVESIAVDRQLIVRFGRVPQAEYGLGRTYFNLGNLLFRRGRLKESGEYHRQALAIHQELHAKYPDSADYRRDLAFTQNSLGDLYKAIGDWPKARASYEEAAAISKQLAGEYPAVPEYRMQLAHSRKHLSALLKDLGKSGDAEPPLKQAIADLERSVKEFPDFIDYRSDLASTLNEYGLMLSESGRVRESLAVYRTAIEQWRNLKKAAPDVVRFSTSLALTLSNLGITFLNAGEYQAAEDAQRESLAVYRKLIEAGSDEPDLQGHVAATLQNLGNLLDVTKRSKEAEPLFRESVQLLQALVKAHPQLPDHAHQLAKSHTNLAVNMQRMMRIKDMDEPANAAVDILRKLVEKWPEVPDYQLSLAACLNNLSAVRSSTLRLIEAEPLARESLAMFEKLLEAHPQFFDYRAGAARSAHSLAVPALWRNDFAATRAALEKGRAHLILARKMHPQNVELLALHRSTAFNLSNALARLGDHRTLAAVAPDLIDHSPTPARDAVEAARFLARAMTLAEADAKITWVERFVMSDAYSRQCLNALLKALDRGFRDAKLLQSPEFNAVRSHREFQQLQSRLDKDR
jgi:serine/threonine-protein kinase